jgi:ADP-heptose:LPS heptosyltransferase
VVFGGPGRTEADMAAPLLAALPGAIDLVGGLSLPEVAAGLERAALFVGNDSGLMHLAAAAGAPTIGLFGPTDAATYGPAGPLAAAVIGRDRSMGSISVDQVAAAVAALLREPAPA